MAANILLSVLSLFCLFFFLFFCPFSIAFRLFRFIRDETEFQVSHLRTLQPRFCGFCLSEAYFRQSTEPNDHVPVIKKFPYFGQLLTKRRELPAPWAKQRRKTNVAEAAGPRMHRVRINNREFNNGAFDISTCTTRLGCLTFRLLGH